MDRLTMELRKREKEIFNLKARNTVTTSWAEMMRRDKEERREESNMMRQKMDNRDRERDRSWERREGDQRKNNRRWEHSKERRGYELRTGPPNKTRGAGRGFRNRGRGGYGRGNWLEDGFGRNMMECFTCGKEGHQAAECGERQNNRGRGGYQGKCYLCDKIGHRMAECPMKLAAKGLEKERSVERTVNKENKNNSSI